MSLAGFQSKLQECHPILVSQDDMEGILDTNLCILSNDPDMCGTKEEPPKRLPVRAEWENWKAPRPWSFPVDIQFSFQQLSVRKWNLVSSRTWFPASLPSPGHLLMFQLFVSQVWEIGPWQT